MADLGWALDLLLAALLVTTLVHAIRLERALRGVRSERATLEGAIAGFDASTRQAEVGLGRMQALASEAGELIGKRVTQATALKDDLAFLTERGESLADRLDALVRAARSATAAAPAQPETPAYPAPAPEPAPKLRSQAERDLLLALRGAR